MGAQHLPGEEVWLIGEHRSTGERKYYLSNLSADTPIKQLVGAIKARWVCEQPHQQLKEELGLDHFEGRSWKGLHRHALMSMIALAFLQSLRLKQAKGGKKNLGPTAETEPAGNKAGYHRPPDQTAGQAMPSLRLPTHRPSQPKSAKVALVLITEEYLPIGATESSHRKCRLYRFCKSKGAVGRERSADTDRPGSRIDP